MSAAPHPPTETLEKVQEQLTCGVCLELYEDPRVLPCLHVFCRRCIRLTSKSNSGSTLFCCPSCRLVTDVTEVGDSALLPAHHIHHLFDVREVLVKAGEAQDGYRCDKCQQHSATSFCRDCGQYICGECTLTHMLWSELRSHDIVSIPRLLDDAAKMLPPKRRVLRCSRHSKDLELYCKTCGELVCHNCTVQQHKTHNYHIAADVFPAHREAIDVNANLLRRTLALVDQALVEFDACSSSITSQRDSIQQNINDTIRRLHDELELRKREFSDQLNEIAGEKLKSLATQRAQVDLLHKQLADALAFTDRHLSTASEGEILMVAKHVVRKSVELVTSYDPDTFVPHQVANMIYKPERLQEACTPYRGVCIAYLCPSKCLVSSKQPLDVAFTNTLTTVVLHPKDENGADYFNPVKHITAALTSPSENIQCRIAHHTNGSYVLSYVPKTPNRSSLCVKICGSHVQGSPFSVLVKRSPADIVMNPRVLKGFVRPCGIDCNSKGELVVVERGLHRIAAVGSKTIMRFGSRGSAPRQFCDPDGVTVDSSDNILVADSGNHRIQKFTAEGEFVAMVGTKGDGPLQFDLPTNIRIHPQTGNMYVCDQYNHRIQIMKEDFSYVGSFGKEGYEDGDFLYPTDLAFDSVGNVFVSDTRNNRIQIFDPDGHFLRMFADEKGKEINFPSPSYLCITWDDTIYVADSSSKLSVFTTQGVSIGTIGKEEGPNMPYFDIVHGIMADKDGKIHATNHTIGTIQVF